MMDLNAPEQEEPWPKDFGVPEDEEENCAIRPNSEDRINRQLG